MPDRNYKILIVDDEPEFHQQIRYAFRRNFEFEGAVSVDKLEKKLKESTRFDLVLLDLVLDKNSDEQVGMSLISVLKDNLPDTPVIITTNSNDYGIAVKAGKLGAFSYLYKGDYDYDEWLATFHEALETSSQSKTLKKELNRSDKKNTYANPKQLPLIGRSGAMEKIRKTLKLLASKPDLTVLITGETGVGKGVAARFLHHNSPQRKEHPFEEIHISNITKSLLESILFGAKKGSFTDAKEDIKGRLHIADNGIVFLDEIGDLDLENQQKLLQFVQHKTIRPMGTTKDIQLDVQIVAATNKNLIQQVANGEFRRDLYQRLNVFPVEIPPLRERREDIRELLMYFSGKTSEDELEAYFEKEVLNYLEQEYSWTGNVRELEHTMQSVPIQQEILGVDKITMDCLPKNMQARQENVFATTVDEKPREKTEGPEVPSSSTPGVPSDLSLEEKNAWITLNAIEEQLIKKNGVKKDVAKALNYNSSDLILYRVKTINSNFPHLLEHFPTIRKKYKI